MLSTRKYGIKFPRTVGCGPTEAVPRIYLPLRALTLAVQTAGADSSGPDPEEKLEVLCQPDLTRVTHLLLASRISPGTSILRAV